MHHHRLTTGNPSGCPVVSWRHDGVPARKPSGYRLGRGDPAVAAVAFLAGAGIGVLGGTVGLGGAEFRLPLLIGVFGFLALPAVILNTATSLIVVLTALPARLISVPASELTPSWHVVVNLLAGSLIGA